MVSVEENSMIQEFPSGGAALRSHADTKLWVEQFAELLFGTITSQ